MVSPQQVHTGPPYWSITKILRRRRRFFSPLRHKAQCAIPGKIGRRWQKRQRPAASAWRTLPACRCRAARRQCEHVFKRGSIGRVPHAGHRPAATARALRLLLRAKFLLRHSLHRDLPGSASLPQPLPHSPAARRSRYLCFWYALRSTIPPL